MDQYYKITEDTLTPVERKKIQRGIYLFVPFTLIFSGLFYYIFSTVSFGETVFWIATFFGSVFVLLFAYQGVAIYLDLKENRKKVLHGLITRKASYRSGKKKRTSYYFYFGKKSFQVDRLKFNQYHEGDLIEIHKGKRVPITFRMERLKSGVMMDTIQEMANARNARHKKIGWIPVVGFLLFIPIFLTGFFWLAADCFDCGPTYDPSINEWVNVEKESFSEEQSSVQQLIFYLNDTLLDEEEGEIKTLFSQHKENSTLSDFILSLDGIQPQPDHERTLLQWVRYKWDEAVPRQPGVTVVEMWRNTLPKLFKKKRTPLQYQNEYWPLQINDDPTISYEAIVAWYGADASTGTRQRVALRFKNDSTGLSPGFIRYIKEALAQPLALHGNQIGHYKAGRKYYGLEGSP
jgi:FtsH-binding integral membrane protein